MRCGGFTMVEFAITTTILALFFAFFTEAVVVSLQTTGDSTARHQALLTRANLSRYFVPDVESAVNTAGSPLRPAISDLTNWSPIATPSGSGYATWASDCRSWADLQATGYVPGSGAPPPGGWPTLELHGYEWHVPPAGEAKFYYATTIYWARPVKPSAMTPANWEPSEWDLTSSSPRSSCEIVRRRTYESPTVGEPASNLPRDNERVVARNVAGRLRIHRIACPATCAVPAVWRFEVDLRPPGAKQGHTMAVTASQRAWQSAGP